MNCLFLEKDKTKLIGSQSMQGKRSIKSIESNMTRKINMPDNVEVQIYHEQQCVNIV